jgi:hypothetical protein
MVDPMMSLYEYLGKAAGNDLGKQVYLAACYKDIKVGMREISNPKYTGNVMLYPKSFLDGYFNPPAPEGVTGEEGEDLPF